MRSLLHNAGGMCAQCGEQCGDDRDHNLRHLLQCLLSRFFHRTHPQPLQPHPLAPSPKGEGEAFGGEEGGGGKRGLDTSAVRGFVLRVSNH